jgi:hypothetical protein
LITYLKSEDEKKNSETLVYRFSWGQQVFNDTLNVMAYLGRFTRQHMEQDKKSGTL